MSRLLVLVIVAACGSTPPATKEKATEQAHDEASAVPATFTTRTRAPQSDTERALVTAGRVLDPALDCVARALVKIEGMQAATYRHELPLRCGSPLYVLHAELVASEDAIPNAIAAVEQKLPKSPLAVAVGIAPVGGKRAFVIARRGIELSSVERSGRSMTITGKLLVDVGAMTAYVSSATGVEVHPVTLDQGALTATFDTPDDALVELGLRVRDQTGPIGRVQVGRGSSLFGRTSTIESLNQGRLSTRMRPIASIQKTQTITCDPIPAAISNVDLSDRARCIDLPLISSDDFVGEIAYRPELQLAVLEPRVAIVELGQLPQGGIHVRLLRPFEAMEPTPARLRVLELLRVRWPTLTDRPIAQGAVANLVHTWSQNDDPYTTSAQHKPALDKLAAKWTRTRTFYTALTAARDLQTALELITPDRTPTAVDVAVQQVRRPSGELVHLIAVVLEI